MPLSSGFACQTRSHQPEIGRILHTYLRKIEQRHTQGPIISMGIVLRGGYSTSSLIEVRLLERMRPECTHQPWYKILCKPICVQCFRPARAKLRQQETAFSQSRDMRETRSTDIVVLVRRGQVLKAAAITWMKLQMQYRCGDRLLIAFLQVLPNASCISFLPESRVRSGGHSVNSPNDTLTARNLHNTFSAQRCQQRWDWQCRLASATTFL